MMVLLTIAALLLGLAYGLSGLELPVVTFLTGHTDAVLYLLMFSVGISVGMYRGLAAKIREYHLRIFIIPAGIMFGSIAGGILCALLLHMPLRTTARPLRAAWAGTAWPGPPLAGWWGPRWAAWHL